MVAARSLPFVLLLGLAAAGLSAGGCTTGTTPVCDDAGSCLILPTEASVDAGTEASVDAGTEASVDAGGVEASAGSDGGDGSTAGDAPDE